MTKGSGDLTKRKPSGGRKIAYRGKRAFEAGSPPTETVIGEKKIFARRARGGGCKPKLLVCKEANVTDPTSGKSSKVQILKVIKNPTNMDYQRRGVITRNAIIDTPLGQAKVTSRPGQDGVVNALLFERAKSS